MHRHDANNVSFGDTTLDVIASGIASGSGVLPPDGALHRLLAKDSAADYDASWHPLEDVATAETDTTLVLAPDGAGGVEFRAEVGGSGIVGGGTTGQALLKDSATNYDASWHDIEDISTAETDTTKRLAPDGTGGVNFVTGGTGGSDYLAHRLVVSINNTRQTININSTTYIDIANDFHFYLDLDKFLPTHFRIVGGFASNAAGQTVTGQLAVNAAPTTPVSSGGNDVTANNTDGFNDSGWVAWNTPTTGFTQFIIAWKGSNSTVDIQVRWVEIHFKR